MQYIILVKMFINQFYKYFHMFIFTSLQNGWMGGGVNHIIFLFLFFDNLPKVNKIFNRKTLKN